MTFEDCMRLAKAAEDAGDGDEALGCYGKALELDPSQAEAWLGKARAIGLLSPWTNLRVSDLHAVLTLAIDSVPAERKGEVRAAAAALLRKLAVAHHEKSKRRLDDYVSAHGEWRRHLERCASAVRALEQAHALDPADPVALEKIIEVCSAQIAGVVYNDVGDYQIVTQRRHGVSQEYEAELRAKIADCAAQLRSLRPDYVPPKIEKAELDHESTCFVATAAMGDPRHPDVVAIRGWRDETLARAAAGRALIRIYEVVGPEAARALRRSPLLRALSRALLVRPLAALLRRLS
jgi:tetratricopeptide (TPR) repeat protein